jgi:uncharacterized RDD family membrane protein YckC
MILMIKKCDKFSGEVEGSTECSPYFGAELSSNTKPAGFWIRVGAASIDGLVFIPIVVLYFQNLYLIKSTFLLTLLFLPGLAYKPLMESFYGATLGKMACGLKVVDKKGDKLNLTAACLRFLPMVLPSLIGLIIQLVLFSSLGFESASTLSEMAQLRQGGPLQPTQSLVGLFVLVDCVVAAFARRKRAIHDMMAGSFCVYKSLAVAGIRTRAGRAVAGFVAFTAAMIGIMVYHPGTKLSREEDILGEIPAALDEKLAIQTKIAFVSISDGNLEIYIMNPDGTERVNLTNNPASDYHPEWLPDGKIKFMSNRDVERREYVMDVHGNIALPEEEPADRPKTFSVRVEEAMTAQRKPLVYAGRIGKTYAIVSLDPDSGKETTLSKGHHSPPSFALSPDGTHIVYDASDLTGHQIYVMNVDGSKKKRLTNSPGGKSNPCWSPDGKMIAFHSSKGGTVDICIMNADGSGQRKLTNGHSDSFPSWSPFLTSEGKAEEGE